MAAPRQHKSQKAIGQNEDLYQAVVIADSFDSKFSPLEEYYPKVLFPIVNTPILQYTLACLNASGIQTVYLFCTRHSEKIKKFIQDSEWSSSTCMQVIVIVSKDCLSFGDALRELDNKGLIRSDFILMTGDIVTNVKLKPYIDEHRERYKNDKKTLMTMLHMEAAPNHRSRTSEDDCVVVLDNTSQCILYHQKIGSLRKIKFPLGIFENNPSAIIRYDLLDCHISICSPQVLPLFSDNFDFQTRHDFVKGILGNEEILGNTIYLDIVKNHYAVRVSDFHMYDAVSKDVIARWAFPFVPDVSVLNKNSLYKFYRKNVYLGNDVKLMSMYAHDVKDNSVIGHGTKVGDNSNIVESVIGCNCKIGDNVEISGSYIWDNVIIEGGCTITSSILGNNVHVHENVKILPACILSYDVAVGPLVTVNEGTVITSAPVVEDDFIENDVNVEEVDLSLVGMKGCGFRYVGNNEQIKMLMSYFKNLAILSDDETLSASDYGESDVHSDDDNFLVDDSKLFYKEVLESLIRAVDEKIPSENIILEINSSKHAYNISVKEVNTLVTKAIIDIPSVKTDRKLEAQELFKLLKPILDQFLPLMKNYMKSIESQKDCLNSLEVCAISQTNFAPCLIKVIKYFYDEEILLEDSILSWYHQPVVNLEDTDDHQNIRNKVLPFINWLEAAEEESDDE